MGYEITLRNVPGTQNTVNLPEGSSVKDLEAHVANFSGSTIMVNGEKAEASTPLKDGDKVVATKAAKGAK